MRVSIRLLVVAACGLALGLPDPGEAGRRRRPPSHEAAGRLTFASPQVNPIALSPDESLLLVASTTSNQVDVISTATNTVIGEVPVGIDPGSIAFKPDGSEAWVSNHVSDSVSVIDTNPASAGYLTVVETVQDLVGGVTEFDEPTGIAFKGDGSEAYVALSSRNDVAIVDTTSYAVTGRVHITAQDPRALFVLGDYLYVAAFESGNQTELSMCEDLSDAPDCTLDAADIADFAINSPNLPNSIKDITIDPGFPDRDLFVFDISGGLADGAGPVDSVTGMGSLLYGLVGRVNGGAHDLYVSQADARNAENGADAAPLSDLDNRMFLNQLTRVSCTSGSCGGPTRMDIEVLVPSQPAAGNALATPYGIVLTSDGSTVVATAAASSRIFTYDATGTTESDVLGRLDVGEIPRGIAFVPSGPSTDAGTAYVLNTLGNSVSVVTVGAGGTLALDGTVAVNPIPVGDDPTPTLVRLGRIAFNDADASTSGTFSCASCHPDGNTDQLLWRIGGQCQACNGEEPRSTMPVRGLRDTVPLHWDGALGDPFGGPSGEDPNGNASPSQTAGGVTCEIDNQQACFRHLVEASLSGVMCDQDPPGCANGPTGEPGLLDDTERQNMAIFLERVSYPPARERPIGDVVSAMALDGFDDFFRDNPGNRGGPLANSLAEPVTCADTTAGCHELPLGTASNSETLAAFEAPTMRGMTDRWLQFSMGITLSEEMLLGMNDGISIDVSPFIGGPPFFITTIGNPFGDWSNGIGVEEDFTFGVAFGLFDLVYGGLASNDFQMFEEASTGHSGALGRQVTLNTRTTSGALQAGTEALLAGLEAADERGVVNLRGHGLFNGNPVEISYKQNVDLYQVGGVQLTSSGLVTAAQPPMPTLIATLTAQLRAGTSESTPQPLIANPGAQCNGDSGNGSVDPLLPTGPAGGGANIFFEAAHVTVLDQVFLNGEPTGLTPSFLGPSTECAGAAGTQITPDGFGVAGLDLNLGANLLQILSINGLLSNELPVIGQ